MVDLPENHADLQPADKSSDVFIIPFLFSGPLTPRQALELKEKWSNSLPYARTYTTSSKTVKTY